MRSTWVYKEPLKRVLEQPPKIYAEINIAQSLKSTLEQGLEEQSAVTRLN